MPDRILQRINTISRNDLYDWCDEYIRENKSDIINLVKERLTHGESVTGSGAVGYYKQISYSVMKEKMNPLADGTVDLFFKGDLFKGLDIIQYGDGYKILSTDEKYERLGEKYGFEEFGITKHQHEELTKELILHCYDKIITKMLG